jgi:hypothetical protein
MIDQKKYSLKKSFYKLKAHHHLRKSRGNRRSFQWQREEDKWLFSHSLSLTFFSVSRRQKKIWKRNLRRIAQWISNNLLLFGNWNSHCGGCVWCQVLPKSEMSLSHFFLFCGLGKHFRLAVNLYKLIVIYLHTTSTLSLWNNSST